MFLGPLLDSTDSGVMGVMVVCDQHETVSFEPWLAWQVSNLVCQELILLHCLQSGLNLHVHCSIVNHLETVDNELSFKLDEHVVIEDDLERPALDDCLTKGVVL